MAPTEPKINKEAATGTTRDILFTVPETLEVTSKPGNPTAQSVIMAVSTLGC
jgi:hypothetical protein